MTINSTTRKAGPYTGTGSQTAFPFAFKVFATSDVLVIKTDTLGNESTLVLNTDYTVALNDDQNANPGGTVNLVSAAPAGYKVTIGSAVPSTQGASIPNNGGFYPKVVEDGLDRATVLLQQLLEQVARSVKFAFSDTSSGNNMPAALVRANNLLGFDAAGNMIAVAPVAGSATQVQADLGNYTDPLKGAAMVGYAGALLSAILKNALFTVVQSLTALRAVKSSQFTRAFVVSEFGNFYYDATDTTSADNGWSVVVAADGGRWKLLRGPAQTVTTGADDSTRYITRATSHSGGTPGYVNTALTVRDTVGSGVANFEWGILSVMDNSATGGENVAIYGQALKRAQGPTWAACFEIRDVYTADPAAGDCLGVEVACSANGGDTGLQRNGIHIAMGKLLSGGTTCEWGRGFWSTGGTDSRFAKAFSNDGNFRIAAFENAGDASGFPGSATFRDVGKANYGIDLSGGTYSTAAIRLGATQKIAFDTNATVTLSENGGVLSVAGSYLQMNQGFGITGAGNIAATANSGTNGALPAQVAGYVIFKIDGANYKLPYFAS